MFKDRKEAGQLLAEKLGNYKAKDKTVVVGIPRGGVPVASELAKKLNLPLDVVVTRKIGAPGQEELAIGAIGPEGVFVFDEDLIQRLGVGKDYKGHIVKKEEKEMKKRIKKFRGQKKIDFKDKTTILADDGIATGATTKAAIKYLKEKGVNKIILATPVVPEENVEEFEELVDEFVYINAPKDFYAVGQFYKKFPQVTNKEVLKLLQND